MGQRTGLTRKGVWGCGNSPHVSCPGQRDEASAASSSSLCIYPGPIHRLITYVCKPVNQMKKIYHIFIAPTAGINPAGTVGISVSVHQINRLKKFPPAKQPVHCVGPLSSTAPASQYAFIAVSSILLKLSLPPTSTLLNLCKSSSPILLSISMPPQIDKGT